jgi:hypothetical protein
MILNRSRPVCHRLAVPAYALLLAACGSSTNSGAPADSGAPAGSGTPLDMNGFGEKYKLADNEVSGWTQSTGSDPFLLFTTKTLTDKIDGAATPYTDQGMQFAMYQNLDGPSGQTCDLTAMHFRTETQAKAMLAARQTLMSASITIPTYDASVASASTSLGGIGVLAAFKDLYLEIALDGYGSDVDSASQVAVKFLQAMQAKTN